MINFFRKIRKKMADDNKPTKYMRYAIGEIVLVVIGILIALQINNWNEDRKQDNRKKEVTQSLILELNEVLSYTRDQVRMMGDRIETYSKILNKWETYDPKSLSKDSLKRYYWLIHTSSILKYNPRVGYYNSLINSGEINLITDSLVIKLNYIYDKHRKDLVTYVDQEADLHVLIAEIVARNHPKIFLSATKSEDRFGSMDVASTINFLNSVKGDGELKSLIFRNLFIIQMKQFLLTERVIPDLNYMLENFKSGS